MAEHFPEPPVSSGLDLRDAPYMPLDVLRLRDSELGLLANGEEFRAAVLLWCTAWHQVPAASLPDDERLLAHFVGLGRDLKTWRKIKERALHRFVKCSDGRLYHPVIAEKALEAEESLRKRNQGRRRNREKVAAWRARNDQSNQSQDDDVTDDVTVTEPVTVTSHVTECNGSNIKEKKEEEESTPLKPPRGRGSRLPENWEPSLDEKKFAIDLGVNPDWEASKFCDYWHAKTGRDGAKLDWSGTWRNWVRTASERLPRQREGPQERGSW